MNAPPSQAPLADLVAFARHWAADDIDEQTRAELERLAALGDEPALRAALFPAVQFGTAGLRGVVGAGPARMNLANVARASWALAEYLKIQGARTRTVVVGYDARPESRSFACLAAEVICSCGLHVLISEDPTPTPCIAYAVRKLGASAGVVLTASHNPRGENGLKVFDGDGVQIVAPWDEQIARFMTQAPPSAQMARDRERVNPLGKEVLDSYFNDVELAASHVVSEMPEAARPGLKLAYTALHGVGFDAAARATRNLLPALELVPVPEQSAPDGTFPTLPFPNPEEPGALRLLLETAAAHSCDAACAHDPDADRFALCLPTADGRLRRLTGDALGLLFADACLGTTLLRNAEIICTVVSSPAVTLLAESYGATTLRTLTGFKWICHAALESESFLFAYEEALGYCFAAPPGGLTAMDKDGVLAMSVASRLLLKAGGGRALFEHLLSIYRRIGLWGSFGHSRRIEGRGARARMVTRMDRLRETPPKRLAGLRVVRMVDFREGEEKRPWYLGAQDLVRFDLEGTSVTEATGIVHGKVYVRPSGTEAKLKAYIHLCSKMEEDADYLRLTTEQERVALAVADALLASDSMLPQGH